MSKMALEKRARAVGLTTAPRRCASTLRGGVILVFVVSAVSAVFAVHDRVSGARLRQRAGAD
jgi:hypothetical protein